MPNLNVHSNMDAKEIHDALLETFEKWVKFSLGVGKLGGQMLRHPSGRLASAIKAEHDKEGNIVAVYIDPDAEDELVKMSGHKGFSLKQRMLQAGKSGVKRSKEGYLYRRVPISNTPTHPRVLYKEAAGTWLRNLFTSQATSQGGILGLNKNLARMWVSEYKKGHGSRGGGKIRTMTNRPGSAAWRIPPYPAFNIRRLLRQMLPANIKDRVII